MMKTRTQLVPIAVWSFLALTALVLYVAQIRRGGVVAIAEGIEHPVGAVRGDRVAAVHVVPGQAVQAGDPLATMDLTLLDAELAVARAEFEAAQAQVAAQTGQSAARLVSWDTDAIKATDSSSLELNRARAELNVKRAEQQAVGTQLKEMESLLGKQLVTKKDMLELEVRHAALEQEIAAAESAVSLLSRQVASNKTRVEALPKDFSNLANQLEAAEQKVVEERIRALEAAREAAVLRSPVAGQVTAVNMSVGGYAMPGMPVVTVVETSTTRVLACVPEQVTTELKIGTRATLHPRGSGQDVEARVVSAASRIGQLPMRCQITPNTPRFGREVWLTSNQQALVPGTAFSVTFGEADGASQAEAGRRFKSLEVPSGLAKRTRMEASALCFSKQRNAYFLVSDDTGLVKQEEHAPWIFSLDTRGRIAETPLAIAGVTEISDLESCAVNGNTLYLLASQSLSRKGNLPDTRKLFLEVEDDGKSLRVRNHVLLADLLALLPPAELAALGITDLATLDIEGMTYHDGALILGLKAPSDGSGNAILWRIAQPTRLFTEKSLTNAGLSRWAQVSLPVPAGGSTVPGGISDLLFTPSGGLLLAATPSAGGGGKGALYHVKSLAGPTFKADKLVTYDSYKPEGLSVGAEAGNFAVVFDTDGGTVYWDVVPWPP